MKRVEDKHRSEMVVLEDYQEFFKQRAALQQTHAASLKRLANQVLAAPLGSQGQILTCWTV